MAQTAQHTQKNYMTKCPGGSAVLVRSPDPKCCFSDTIPFKTTVCNTKLVSGIVWYVKSG